MILDSKKKNKMSSKQKRKKKRIIKKKTTRLGQELIVALMEAYALEVSRYR